MTTPSSDTPSSETQVILLIDLATDNPIDPARLEALIPPAQRRHLLRLSDFGAKAAARGTSVRERRTWVTSINRMLAKAYPRSTGVGPTWRIDLIELPNGPAIEALSTGQALRGRRKNQHRPTLIVADDLQNDSHIVSANQRELSHKWFHGSLLPAGDKRSNIVELTPHGCTAIEAAQSAVRELDFALLARTLNDREQQRLAQLLRKLLVSLEPRHAATKATRAAGGAAPRHLATTAARWRPVADRP